MNRNRGRMFSLDVVDTDKFLELPTKAQYLYFHLGMAADDDGFLNISPGLLKRIDCGMTDLEALEDAGYIIRFESGVIAIRDWNINDHIPQRQYTPTKYQRERSGLALVNGVYRLIQEYAEGLDCCNSILPVRRRQQCQTRRLLNRYRRA